MVRGVFDAARSRLDVIGVWGAMGGIQHFWTDRVRSNLNFGHVSARNPASAPSDALRSTSLGSANIVWNPFERLTVGFECSWGRREDLDGAVGTSWRFLWSSRFDF